MNCISISELEKNLDYYLDILENNKDEFFIITKNGKRVAKLISPAKRKLGIAKGLWRDVSEEEFNDFDLMSLMGNE